MSTGKLASAFWGQRWAGKEMANSNVPSRRSTDMSPASTWTWDQFGPLWQHGGWRSQVAAGGFSSQPGVGGAGPTGRGRGYRLSWFMTPTPIFGWGQIQRSRGMGEADHMAWPARLSLRCGSTSLVFKLDLTCPGTQQDVVFQLRNAPP